MPFTLAHPAAVLPFRRFCPRHFNFPALVIGSITPDIGYLFGRWNVDEFSHSLPGSLGFGLPVGIVLMILFYSLRLPVIGILPKRQRQIFFPLCQRPVGSLPAAVISLLFGIWTHLLLDSFTHKHGWLVEHLPVLQANVFSLEDKTLRIYNLLWYVCSLLGIAWLCFAYERWRELPVEAGRRSPAGAKLLNALLVALFILPVSAIHVLLPGWPGLVLTAIFSAAIIVGIGLRV